MRIATFNMENLFERPRVLNAAGQDEGRAALEDVTRLSEIIARDPYSDQDKLDIVAILTKHGLAVQQPRNPPFTINTVRNKLTVLRQSGALEVVAKGRSDWVGWVRYATDELAWEAVGNTGKVVDAIRPDIMLCVEVENRPALQRFQDQVLTTRFPEAALPFNVLVDGNDPRGIDLGLLSRHPIVSVRTHIFDPDKGGGHVFSRDCAEYEIALPGGKTLLLLGNHFKSKGFGNFRESAERRLRQARRVNEIYQDALGRSEFVIVGGDLNDTPDSLPLQALVEDTGLRDVMTHPSYHGKPGTYGTGNTVNNKIDYLLLSPALWPSVKAVDVERRGVFTHSGERFETVTSKATEASDHGALYADLDI